MIDIETAMQQSQDELKAEGYKTERVLDHSGVTILRAFVPHAHGGFVRPDTPVDAQYLSEGSTEFLPECLRNQNDAIDQDLLCALGLNVEALSLRREWDRLDSDESVLLNPFGLKLNFSAEIRESDHRPFIKREFLLSIGVDVEAMLRHRLAIDQALRGKAFTREKFTSMGLNLRVFVDSRLTLSSFRAGCDLRLLLGRVFGRARRIACPIILRMRWADLIVHPQYGSIEVLAREDVLASEDIFSRIAENAIGLAQEMKTFNMDLFLHGGGKMFHYSDTDTEESLRERMGL